MKQAVRLKQVIVMVLAFAMICVPIDLVRPQVYAEDETDLTGGTSVAVPEKPGDYVIMSSEMPDGDSEKIVETEIYHGRRSKNWLASYKYITAVGQSMAKSNNSTLSYPSLEAIFPYAAPKDIKSTYFQAIKSTVTSDIKMDKMRCNSTDYSNTGWLNWSHSLILNGASQTAKNKSIFIYGLALHDLTDTFAHATYITEYSKTLKKVVLKPIVHEKSIMKPENASSRDKFVKKGGYVFEADEPETPKGARNRWRDAAYGTKELVKRAKSADVGSVYDFAPNDYREKGKSKGRGYYLDEPINKALKIKASSTWSKMFESVDCIY